MQYGVPHVDVAIIIRIAVTTESWMANEEPPAIQLILLNGAMLSFPRPYPMVFASASRCAQAGRWISGCPRLAPCAWHPGGGTQEHVRAQVAIRGDARLHHPDGFQEAMGETIREVPPRGYQRHPNHQLPEIPTEAIT